MQIKDQSTWEGRLLQITWNSGTPPPPREEVTQVSALCFTRTGKMLLIGAEDGVWSLPGGHPEDGESLEEALAREVAEEACAVVEHCVYLGAQKVEDPALSKPYYQTRYWARVRLKRFAALYNCG